MLGRMGVELDRAAELPGHALAVVQRLEDPDEVVRWAAVHTLGKLEAAAFAQHAAAFVAKLEDSAFNVRCVAVQTLGRLEAETLAQHAAAVAARLEDSSMGVRWAAVETLGKLDAATLAQHAAALVAMLEESDFEVCGAAVYMLGKLDAAALAPHEQALAKAATDDEDDHVRSAAAENCSPNCGRATERAHVGQEGRDRGRRGNDARGREEAFRPARGGARTRALVWTIAEVSEAGGGGELNVLVKLFFFGLLAPNTPRRFRIAAGQRDPPPPEVCLERAGRAAPS